MSSYIKSVRSARYLFMLALLCFVPSGMAQALDAQVDISTQFKQAASVEIINTSGKISIKPSGLATSEAFIQPLNRSDKTKENTTDTHKALTHDYDLVVYL